MEPLYRAEVRGVVVLGAWLVAGALALFVTATTAVGPTLVMVSSHRGAQSGDLAFALLAAGGATALTRWVGPLSGTDLRVLVATATWIVASFLTLLVAALTSVGPVLVTLSWNHGVHTGDALFGLCAATGSALVTHVLLTTRVTSRQSRPH